MWNLRVCVLENVKCESDTTMTHHYVSLLIRTLLMKPIGFINTLLLKTYKE